MANSEEIKHIELRRLAELERVRAYKGLDTEPEVLLEIADLRQKYGQAATAVSRDANPIQENREPRTVRDLWNEVDFLRALIGSVLVRINSDAGDRRFRQRVQTAWMGIMTLMLLYILMRGLWL